MKLEQVGGPVVQASEKVTPFLQIDVHVCYEVDMPSRGSCEGMLKSCECAS